MSMMLTTRPRMAIVMVPDFVLQQQQHTHTRHMVKSLCLRKTGKTYQPLLWAQGGLV